MDKIKRRNKVISRLVVNQFIGVRYEWIIREQSFDKPKVRVKVKENTYPAPPFKKWVKLDNGEIIKAYYDDKLKEPRTAEYDAEKGGYLITYDKVLKNGIATCAGLVVATANTKKELNSLEKVSENMQKSD